MKYLFYIFTLFLNFISMEPKAMEPSLQWDPDYEKPCPTGGFRERIQVTLYERFSPKIRIKEINITFHKNMLLTVEKPDEAKIIVTFLRKEGMKGIHIDRNNDTRIFIKNGAISYFLKNVLGFDKDYMIGFTKNFKL